MCVNTCLFLFIVTLKIFFGIRLETIDETDLVGTWESELFNERVCACVECIVV